MFQNQNNAMLGGASGSGGGAGVVGNAMNPTQPQNINYNGMQQQQPQQQQQQQQPPIESNIAHSSNKPIRKKPYVKITEQPASKALRFRYECEGRSAGSIPGVNSTTENKTYPTIEIVGYKGRAVVVVSCVTKDQPYRPHPHNLVGKEGCKKGVCTLEINSETMRAVFSNLGIQCVKKKDIEAALKAREEIRVDPYKTGFSHRFQPSSIDLNSVRLCFQVFMEGERGRFTQPLPPVVSDPIFDKKAMSDLVICRLCSCSASVLGNTQIILLCEKVAKEDIAVRFFEEKNGQLFWEALGEFQHTDVHKQTAITFKTPKYHTLDITEPAKVFIQLRRPSDGVTSEPLPFEYVPLDSGRHTFWNIRRYLKRKPDEDIFEQILVAGGEKKPPTAVTEVIDLNTPTAEQQPGGEMVFSNAVTAQQEQQQQQQQQQQQETSTPEVTTTTTTETQVMTTEVDPQAAVEAEAAKRRNEQEVDTIINEKVREMEQQHQLEASGKQAEEVQQPIDEQAPTALSVNDKINEWMKSNELLQMDGPLPNSEVVTADSQPSNDDDEDKTLNELLEQVAELEGIYADHTVRRDNYNNSIMTELRDMDECVPDKAPLADGGQTAMDIDDNFDDAATYSSLQKAFKNPIDIPMDDLLPLTPPSSNMAPEDAQHYDHVEVMSSPAPAMVLAQSEPEFVAQQAPPRPEPAKINSPHMHVTAAEEEKLPPLPPKRSRKPDSNAENRSIEANSDRKSRPTAPIIIMRSPNHSPPSKRLPPKPNSNTLPKQKKPGFFSKLFSRKSKSDLSQVSEQTSRNGSKAATPNESREASISHFNMNDPNRASVHSLRSLQPTQSLPTSPAKGGKAPKTGRPVGRSVSSVSGKRPARLDAAVIHIPLKGESVNSLPQQEAYSNASTATLSNTLGRKTVSALQLAEIPLSEGNMELVAIADRQSLRNLCEGEFNVQLDPDVDLTEAEHFALYTSIPPQATVSEFDENSEYYAPVDAGEILTPDEFARRLVAANRSNN